MTRNNPKYSVMFIDDIGVELAKREGLIEQLPRAEIPNMERLLNGLNFYDGFGAGFALSAAGMAYNTATGRPLLSYGDQWDPKLKGRFLMETPKARCPTLVITTDGSGLASVDQTKAWQQQIQNSTLVVLPGNSYHVAPSHVGCERRAVRRSADG